MNCFRLLFFSLVVISGLLLPSVSRAVDEPARQPHRRLKVAVLERPPYSFKDKNGVWKGLGIELWEQIAERLALPYDYVEVPLTDIDQKLSSGECDLSPVIAITVEMSDRVEYTEPYLFSHGAVVTLRKSFTQRIGTFYSYVWSKEVMFILIFMMVGMAIFSLILVWVERKHEHGHFNGPSLKGIGSALWFSAVTMTTVGYGDKTPLSAAGRVITFFWMLIGVLLIALFTGTVASSITMRQLQQGIVRFDDLARYRVGCFEGSRTDLMLKHRGIPAVRYSTPEGGFEGFASKQINAYAGDSISLEYWMNHLAPGKFQISKIPDSEMMYAFATKPGLPEYVSINRQLLQIALAPDWRAKVEHWTGPLSF